MKLPRDAFGCTCGEATCTATCCLLLVAWPWPRLQVRLLMCYSATHLEKLDPTREQQWQKVARLTPEDMACVTNLEFLGVPGALRCRGRAGAALVQRCLLLGGLPALRMCLSAAEAVVAEQGGRTAINAPRFASTPTFCCFFRSALPCLQCASATRAAASPSGASGGVLCARTGRGMRTTRSLPSRASCLCCRRCWRMQVSGGGGGMRGVGRYVAGHVQVSLLFALLGMCWCCRQHAGCQLTESLLSMPAACSRWQAVHR